MGLAKFLEDNVEITYERLYEREENIIGTEKKVIWHDCYYCNASFENSELRNIHIKRSHNVVGPLLFINGRIIQEREYYVDELISAKIVMCGFTGIEITVDNKKTKDNSIDVDLMNFFKKHWNNSTLKIGSTSFNLHRFNEAQINQSKVDSIIKDWEYQVMNKLPLSPAGGEYPSELNDAEVRYLNGLSEYFTACKEGINAKDKNDRYKSAYALLSSFSALPPKGRLVLKIIAFRWLWIEKLTQLTNISGGSFNYVVDFCHGKESQYYQTVKSLLPEHEIYIEPNTLEIIQAIIAYQNNEKEQVQKYLENWSDELLSKIQDSNLKDKILLIKARCSDCNGDYRAAKNYYSRILTPFFKIEAIKYVK